MVNFFNNFYAVSSLINAITSTCVFILVLVNCHSALNRAFLYFSFSVAYWAYCYFFWQLSSTANSALFWCHSLMVGAIFIPPTFFHFSVLLVSQYKKYYNFIVLGYVSAVIFLFLNFFSTNFIIGIESLLIFPFWPIAGKYYILFLLFFGLYTACSHLILFNCMKGLSGLKKNQISFVFWGTIIGFLGGGSNYPLWFKIPILPVGNVLVAVYVLMVAVSVIRYRLMDIKIALTRAGIFLFVYTLVLGVPFWIGFSLLGTGTWLLPVSIMAILATGGPFIYLFIQRRAEDTLLKEQREYQSTLRQASLGMGRIKDLRRLLNLIVQVVTRSVKLKNCEVFLFHEESNQFILKASKRRGRDRKVAPLSAAKSPLVKYFKRLKEPLVQEEVRQLAHDQMNADLVEVADIMKLIDAALVVPCFIENRLIALIALGEKRSGKLFSQDDLVVFSILANQSALAIENAQFYESMKKTHEQLFKAEKMATLGTMADGLSHQINNRLHAMGFIAGDALDSLQLLQKRPRMSKEIKGLVEGVVFALGRIQENVKRGGEIVEGLLKYSRKDDEGEIAVELSKLLDAAIEMAQFKMKVNQMEFVHQYAQDIPAIKGNFTQLQEVFFNIIDNAYDAIMQRKEELKEKTFQGILNIEAQKKGKTLEIIINDNGMGVKKEDQSKLFTPFFTTKLSSKKGTGLGLYVIRQIIEENHHGSVEFTSSYRQGSQTVLRLPIFADVASSI